MYRIKYKKLYHDLCNEIEQLLGPPGIAQFPERTLTQAAKTIQDQKDALDIAAKLVNQLSHVFGDDLSDFGGSRNRQWAEWAEKFLASAEGKKADKRRIQKFWNHCVQASKEVESWPKWLKGV